MFSCIHQLDYQWKGDKMEIDRAAKYICKDNTLGYADMEYPMMINEIQAFRNDLQECQNLLQIMKLRHTYFLFYMGINETRYAFMDEGWATTFRIFESELMKNGEIKQKNSIKTSRKKWINLHPQQNKDQPIHYDEHTGSGYGYGNNSYVKGSSLSYLAFKGLCGDECIQESITSLYG
ncbi:hypothetical protein FQA39_LY18645 [Lamprigera yunnana]|nr:hypothetical protein FQA39_LY18645 [Lamprigera yunnana]